MGQNQTVKDNRITVIDALRGFALLGVVLVHMQQHYSIFNFGAFTPTEPAFPVLDEWIGWLTRNVLMGRFINIFAFLFGMSFFIQMDRAARKGVDFRRRFIWRMVILFLIGVVGRYPIVLCPIRIGVGIIVSIEDQSTCRSRILDSDRRSSLDIFRLR